MCVCVYYDCFCAGHSGKHMIFSYYNLGMLFLQELPEPKQKHIYTGHLTVK